VLFLFLCIKYAIFIAIKTYMNIEEIRDYCLAKPGVTEGFPFGQDVLVFKVMNKMFALTVLKEIRGFSIR